MNKYGNDDDEGDIDLDAVVSAVKSEPFNPEGYVRQVPVNTEGTGEITTAIIGDPEQDEESEESNQ